MRAQRTIAITTTDQTSAWSALAHRVAGWHGQRPAPDELAAVLALVHARLVIIRHADAIEAWGRAATKGASTETGRWAARALPYELIGEPI